MKILLSKQPLPTSTPSNPLISLKTPMFLGVKDPESLKYFLEKLAAKKEEIKQIVTE